jgi:PHD/YefM family antitoxin component YafN of YafNO toxin-antitoxin module
LKEKFITTNELANDASKILRELKAGEAKVVLRYSDPVGVLISWDDYKRMQNQEQEQVHECKACLGAIKRKPAGNVRDRKVA